MTVIGHVNPLIVFDFDDTIVRSSDMIHVHHSDGTSTSFDTSAFARYRPKRGDRVDYSDFSRPIIEADVLEHFETMLDAISQFGRNAVMVLTARHDRKPVAKLLSSLGVKGIDIVALGAVSASAKANWLRDKIIEDDHDLLEFFDDNSKNVREVSKLRREFPDTRIITHRVS